MPDKYIHTEVEGKSLKLTNLNKVLYPTINVSKAEIIKYYLNVGEIMLRYCSDRPLTVIRFPDGITGTSFYSKDKPDWTPEWIDSINIQHEEKIIDYLLINNRPGLAWLGNLACLELHPMQFKSTNNQQPDFFVVDLDPDEGLDFERVKEAAFKMKNFLSGYGYTPYIKTSGGKGLHLYIPIVPKYSFDQMLNTVKLLAKLFVQQYSSLYTLQISKTNRQGKILIDIYRNHMSNTTVAPYSLRGKTGAPISMPIHWNHLDDLASSNFYTISNYQEYLEENEDIWKNWRIHECQLHNLEKVHAVTLNDDRLLEYINKRDFSKTTEPVANVSHDLKDSFVIQLHNASNLHYDLRLENNGVLMSWAIPKGLPYKSDQKRLCIRTEDHPIKYLNFEGVIPKGQYGAGEMWICDQGKIQWTKKTKDSFSFSLNGSYINRTFKLFKTGQNDHWMITSEHDYVHFNDQNRLLPMLAGSSRKIPKGTNYRYEVKWDGIRALIYIEDDRIAIYSRNGRNITQQFPELQLEGISNIDQMVLDTEIVVLDDKGRPLFHDVVGRMHKKGNESILKASKLKPAICYVFDMITLDGINISHLPFERRRAWLEVVLNQSDQYRISNLFKHGNDLFDAVEKQNMEGIMAKDLDSKYWPGKRTEDWIKIKSRKLEQCMIIGYTKGQGDRAGAFGALHLAKMTHNKMQYMGKVGTGFDQKMLKSLYGVVSNIEEIKKPVDVQIEEESRTTWITPLLRCEIEYASLSSNGTFREPVFIKLNETK